MGRPKLPPDPNKISRQRYAFNRIRQQARGVEWKISWADWHDFWLQHGIDKNVFWQSNDDMTLCLYRKNLNKPFQKSNIFLATKAHGMKGLAKPAAWLHKDPDVHKKFDPWHKARSQAHYRGEEWLLTFEEFQILWTDDLWAQRGRASDNLAMTRQDPEGPWSLDNCMIVTRKRQLQMAHEWRLINGLYGPRKKRK